jgi:thiosulfate dehydrogenase (quinone) large subunit
VEHHDHPSQAARPISRRRVVLGGAAAAITGAATWSGGAADAAGKPAGRRIGAAKEVPVGGSIGFTDPSTQLPSLAIQLHKNAFVAYDAVCPHEGCTVAYLESQKIIQCPCHGSQFNPVNGHLVRGPAPHGLKKLKIAASGGELFVQG